MERSFIQRLLVGHASHADGSDMARARGGWFGDQIVSKLNGDYFEHAARGRAFIYASAAAGVTFAVPGNNLPTIWNPAGSGKLWVPIKVVIGYVSATNVAGHLCWAYQNNVGSALGTAAPMSAFTDISPLPCAIGSAAKAGVRFATTVTFTAAPTYLRPVGISTAAMAATTATSPFRMEFEEDGTLMLMPGNALQLAANAAVAMVASVAIIGYELPLPPGFEI